MTNSEFNSLQRELARTRQTETHPEADMLTAFAEGMLAPRERVAVMEHLATCAGCRKVMALAAEAAPQALAKALDRRPRTLLRTWLLLAPAAACIVIASAVAIRFAQKPRAQYSAVAARPPEPTGMPQTPPRAPSTVDAQRAAKKSAPAAGPRPSEVAAQTPVLESAPPAAQDSMEANRTPSSGAASGSLARGGSSQAALKAMDKPLPAVPQAPAFANTVTTHALSSAAASIVRPHWRINEQGQVERSFGGDTWQIVLGGASPKIRVLSMAGGEVWAGGEETRVYRSADNGNTWTAIVLPQKNATDHVIVHIHFDPPQQIRIEAADGTCWLSSDGGATWN